MKNRLKRFFLSERNIMAAILLNALIITLLYFPQFSDAVWLTHIDLFFVVLFSVEAIVKLRVLKPNAYFSNAWNRFDFILVAMSWPAFLELFLPIPNTSLLLLLRMFRLVRLVRFFRFIPHLGSVLRGLSRALRATVFVVVALFFLNFLFALFSCHFFRELSPERFGDPLIASYSIFQMFTIEGWYEIPAELVGKMEKPVMAGLTRFYFVLVVLIGGIFGLSLANAVFVDEMTLDNNEALERKVDQLQDEIRALRDMLQQNRKT